MIELDMQTVMFANVIISIVSMVVMFILWFQNRNKYSGLAFWVLDWILVAGGTLLITLQGTVPAWESMILSNSMIVGGTLILYFGLSRFAGKKNKPLLVSLVLVAFVIFVAVHIYYVYIHNDLIARNYNAALGLLLACSLCSWLMFKGVNPQIRRISKGTGISFIIIAVVCLIRILGFSLIPQTGNQFLQSNKFDVLMVMLLVGSVAFLVVNLVLLVNRRLYIETEEMENTIKRSVMELQAIFQTTSIGFGILINRVIKEINDAGCQTLGYSREELIGKESRMFYPTDEEYEAIGQIYPTIAQTGSSMAETRLLRKDGEIINVIMNIAAFDKNDLAKGVVFSILDITERKQLEEKAVYLASFPELNPNPILELDQEGKISYANPVANRLFPDITNIREKHPFLADWINVVKELQTANWSETVIREIKVGNEYYEQAISPVSKNQIRIYARNITERKRAEAALKDSEEKYSTLIEQSIDGILILKNRLVTFANRRIREMTGFSQEEILGKTFIELAAPEYKAMLDKEYHRRQAGEEVSGDHELEILTKDGRKIAVETKVRRIVYQGQPAAMSIIRDITERKRVEKQLKESEENLRISLENAPDGIYLSDLNGVFLYGNKKAEEIIGYQKEELIGNNFFKLNLLPTKYLPKIGELLKLNAIGKPTGPDELELIRKDKTQVWVEISTATIKQKGNDVVIGFVRNITERKRAEEQIKASLAEKETLLKEVHHRVKNNMQVISSLLRLQAGRVKDKDSAALLSDSQNRIQSMALVYNKLYQSQDVASINMAEYINELIAGLIRSYASNPNKVMVNIVCSGVLLGVDTAIPCGLVINELVTNSLKYAFPKNMEGQISISLKEDNNQEMELVVSDNGVGISDGIDVVDNTTLGLKLVGNLVQNQLGGKIELVRNQGTTYKITFRQTKEEK